ncbi:MAG: hypothetical protein PF693_07865 [Spirochaetia bacterium]|jgi:hypothetical protein|nr:hypothetical protein [Spirochaetia bacterium]
MLQLGEELRIPLYAGETNITPNEGFKIAETKGIVFQWRIDNEEMQIF